MKWTRVIAVKVGNSWQATVRDGPFWQVGEFRPTLEAAIENAVGESQSKSSTDLGDMLR